MVRHLVAENAWLGGKGLCPEPEDDPQFDSVKMLALRWATVATYKTIPGGE